MDINNEIDEKMRVTINSDSAYKLREYIHILTKSRASDAKNGDLNMLIDPSKKKVKFLVIENELETEVVVPIDEIWLKEDCPLSICRFLLNLKNFDIYLQLRNEFEYRAISFSVTTDSDFMMKIYVEEYGLCCNLRLFKQTEDVFGIGKLRKRLWKFHISDKLCEGFRDVIFDLAKKNPMSSIYIEKLPFSMLGIRDISLGYCKLHIATEEDGIENHTLMSYSLLSLSKYLKLFNKLDKLNFQLNENGSLIATKKEGRISIIGRFYLILEEQEELEN